MRQTLNRYYIYALLGGFGFSWTTWLAFVVARGGNPGWAESAYHLAILLGEVPTGIAADLLGRRRSMVIGLLLGALSCFGYLLIDNTLTACLVLALSGLGLTFRSGADTALLYETAEEVGGPDLARRALARASALQMAAMASAPLVAGWLYEQHPLAPFFAQGALSLVAAAVVVGMQDRQDRAPKGALRNPWRHTGTALRYLLRRPALLGMIAFTWAYAAVGSMANQFGQVYFPSVGLTMLGAGLVFTLTRTLGAVTSWAAERMTRSAASRWLRYGPLGQAVLYLAMGLTHTGLGAAAFVVGDGLDGFITPALSARINEAIPSEQRATILSFESLGCSLLVAAAFPAAAALPSVQSIYLATGGAAVAAALLWLAGPSPRDAGAAVRPVETQN